MTNPRAALVTRGWIYAIGEWTPDVKVKDHNGDPLFNLDYITPGIWGSKLFCVIRRTWTVRDSAGNCEVIQFLVDQPMEVQEQ